MPSHRRYRTSFEWWQRERRHRPKYPHRRQRAGPRVAPYFVDILRLIASFQMVNGHTLDAVLLPTARGGEYWSQYLWFRGMVSVAFMFVAGFAFHLATLARFEAHRSRPVEIRRRFRRGIDLIIIGYLLRFPFDYLHRLEDIPESLISVLLRCNVLQCIGVTLILLEALTVCSRRPEHVAWFAALLSACVVAVAPITDAWIPTGGWQPLLAYVSHGSGSLFPVIPWSVFMLSGCAIGFWAMPQSAATPWRVTLARLLVVALGLWVFGKVLGQTLPMGWVPSDIHVNSRPAFIVQRLTAIVVAVAALCLVAAPIRRFPRGLRILSGETLFLYVFHLVVVFSLPFGVSRTIGKTLPLSQAAGVSCGMLVLTAVAGLGWHRFKEWQSKRKRAAV